MAPIRRAAPRADFSSHPSDLELINTYLLPFVATGQRPWKFIHDADVYAAGPGALTAAYTPATASDGQEAWYFFTSLRARSRRGKRKTRTVGSGEEGCWHSERAAKPLVAGIRHSRQIGYRQSFSFATKEDGRLVRSGWLMAEIGLNYDGLGGEGSTPEEELVLCKVYRSPRVGPAPGAERSTAAAARGVGPAEIRRGKETEYSASSSEEGTPSAEETKGKAACPRAGPAHLPSGNSAQQIRVSGSDSASTESDSEQDSPSSSHGGCATGASTAPRAAAGDAARAPRPEAYQAPGNPFLASSPIRRLYPAPQIAMVPSRSDAPHPDFGHHPSDQELVKAYLIPRVASGENNWKFIHDADVYGADPADLTREYSPATASDGEKAWYFFTSLPAKSVRGQRRPRTVGSGEGCWHSEAGVKAVVDGGRQIGRRQFFSFMKREDGQRVRTGWIMVEIGLNHGREEDSSDELVLCKVYRSPRAGPAPGAVESTAAAAPSRRKKKADSNNSVATTPVLAPPPGAKKSTAAAATATSGRKRKADDKKSATERSVLGPERGAKKSTATLASASAGRKKTSDKNSGAACPEQLCTRCRIETAESHSGTAGDDAAEEDETRGKSETGVLEHDSMTDESAAPDGNETGDSSGSAGARPPFYHFV